MNYADLVVWLVIGHLIGDYLLQSKETALRKSQPGAKGFLAWMVHCLSYSLAVVSILWTAGLVPTDPEALWDVYMVIFLSHGPVDRWSLADKWLKRIRGRRLADFQKHVWQEATPLKVAEMATEQAFAAIVYTVVDNSLHLLLMLGGLAGLHALGGL